MKTIENKTQKKSRFTIKAIAYTTYIYYDDYLYATAPRGYDKIYIVNKGQISLTKEQMNELYNINFNI